MKTNRRTFIKQGSALVASSALLSHTALAFGAKDTLVGIQLYCVRDEMKKDPMGTLKQVATMGYKNVEHANYVDRKFYGYSAKEFRKILDDLGLKMPSGHTVMRAEHYNAAKKEFTDVWKYTVEDAAVLGQQFVISPWLDESLRGNEDGIKSFMEVFNKSGELCQKSGMKFGYHNHDFEFSEKFGDNTLYDLILKYTDPKLVIQQLDIGNLYNGGATALPIVKKYPGRFVSLHVKDEIEVGDKHESTILGTGVVPVKEIIDLCKKDGSKHFIIEQESYQGKMPLDAIKLDLMQMNKWGYT